MLLIFHHLSHVWQNPGFQVMDQNAKLWPIKLRDSLNRGKKKEVNDKIYFCHGDKHQSFLQVDTIRWKLYFKKNWCLLELGIS